MPSYETREKVGEKVKENGLRQLYKITKEKFKVKDPDGHYGETTIYWEGLEYCWNVDKSEWDKIDKRKYRNEIDAKLWVKWI